MTEPITNPNLKVFKQDPILGDLMDLLKKDIMLNLNCHAIGTIQSFDSDTQTVSISMNYTQTYTKQKNGSDEFENEYVDYPVLVDCPVIVVGGGLASLTMPIAKGDQCMIFFNDRAIDDWYASGQKTNLTINRFHSISDGFALVGIHSKLNPIANYDEIRALIIGGTAKIGLNPTNNKVVIQNGTRNLRQVLQDLVTHLQTLITQTAAITVTGVTTGGGTSGPPANAAAITAVLSQLSTDATRIAELIE